jgi:hypothetical protein
MEDTVLRALYALLVVLFSFAGPAQALDSLMAVAYLDDCFGEITEPSIAPAQILASEAAVEKVGEFVDEVDEVAITGPNDTVHVPVGAIKPGDEMPTVEYSSLVLPVDDTIEQSTMLPQIVATEPMIEKFCEAFDDDVPIGVSDAADVVVRETQPSDSE